MFVLFITLRWSYNVISNTQLVINLEIYILIALAWCYRLVSGAEPQYLG